MIVSGSESKNKDLFYISEQNQNIQVQWAVAHPCTQCGSSLRWHEQVEFQVVTLTCCLTEGRRHQKNLLFGKQHSLQKLKRPNVLDQRPPLY